MVKRYNVSSVQAPGGRYSHVGEIGPNPRVFHLSGVLGVAPDGRIGEGIEEQATLVYQNIAAMLKECGMDFENLVKVAVFLTDPNYIDAWRTVQREAFGEVFPANTLLIISRLVRPEFVIEVEVVAAID